MPVAPRNVWPVAIAGGGIGGLACALALARHGFQSLVLGIVHSTPFTMRRSS